MSRGILGASCEANVISRYHNLLFSQLVVGSVLRDQNRVREYIEMGPKGSRGVQSVTGPQNQKIPAFMVGIFRSECSDLAV